MNGVARNEEAVRPLSVTIAFAVASSWLLSLGQTGDVIPFGDGVGFAKRGIELHGLLYSGQFGRFLELLTSPSTFTFLPTYVLLFLVPTSMVGGATYGVINCLCWNVMLALGLHGILNVVGRPRLAPWLFLLTVANNNALDPSYYFYMDLPFMGWALVAVWIQVLAWHRQSWRSSLMAGLAAASLFFVKPANAFLFLALFFVAESIHAACQVFVPRYAGAAELKRTIRHLLIVAGGAVVMFLVALPFGLLQVIASRMSAMQEDYARTVISLGPVLRAFYFPLCLTYYYSALWLVILAGVMGTAIGQIGTLDPASERNRFAQRTTIALAASYLLVWGLAFSFLMPAKVIRSLTLMLPMIWIVVTQMPFLRRVPVWGVAAFATAYFVIANTQAFMGVVPKTNRIAEHYILDGDWLNRLPGKKDLENHGTQISRDIEKALDEMGIHEGKVTDGTEMMYWTATSLNWFTQVDDLRNGRKPAREFTTACDNRGFPIERALEDCHALLLVVHPALQYSKGVFEFNTKTADYAIRHWKDKEARDVRVFEAPGGVPMMVIVAFRDSLSRESLETLMHDEFPQGFSSFAALEQSFETPKTLQECLRLIFATRKASP